VWRWVRKWCWRKNSSAKLQWHGCAILHAFSLEPITSVGCLDAIRLFILARECEQIIGFVANITLSNCQILLTFSLQRRSDEIPADFQYAIEILLSLQEKNKHRVELFISFSSRIELSCAPLTGKIPAKIYHWCCKTACDLHDNCKMTWQTMRDQFS